MSKDWFMLSPSNVINNQQTGRLASDIAAGNRATEFFNSIDPLEPFPVASARDRNGA
jgi:hypothetical protein